MPPELLTVFVAAACSVDAVTLGLLWSGSRRLSARDVVRCSPAVGVSHAAFALAGWCVNEQLHGAGPMWAGDAMVIGITVGIVLLGMASGSVFSKRRVTMPLVVLGADGVVIGLVAGATEASFAGLLLISSLTPALAFALTSLAFRRVDGAGPKRESNEPS